MSETQDTLPYSSVNTRQLLLLLIGCGLFLSETGNLHAQATGRITGTLTDASNGETLFGANILVEGTTRGTTTDFEGAYTLSNLEPGTYTLVYRYITYATKTVTGIVVKAGEATRVDVALQPEAVGLGEITITADANRESAASLLAIQRRSVAFQDGLSIEQISRTGSSNVADAMTKVVGASVVDGKYVFVRGLGDRYSSTHLNGMELPSADPDKKAFQLDLIPSRLLDNVVTLKTFTPDRPGNFSGGLVDVATKQFPENYTFSFSMSSSYNNLSTFDNGLLPQRSSTDWLGYDDGMRALPAELRGSPSIPAHIQAQFDGAKAAELDRYSRAFNAEMAAGPVRVPLNRSFSLTIGNQHGTRIGQFGYVFGGSYNRHTSSYADGQVGIYKLVGDLDQADGLTPVNAMTDAKTSESVDIGLLGSVSYRINPYNRVTFNAVRTQSGTSTGRYIQGFWDETNEADFQAYESRVIEYTQRALGSYQLQGRHMVEALGNLDVDWNLSLARNSQDQPDLRYLENGVLDNGNGESTYSLSAGLFQRPARFFRELDEENRIASLDLTYPARTKQGQFKIKAGGYAQGVNRVFRENRFDIYQGRSSATFTDFDLDWNRYFAHAGVVDTTNRYVFGNYVVDASNPKNSYDADSETYAGYLMTELPIGALRLVGGVRVENARIRSASRDTTLGVGRLDDTDLLPSLTAIYALSENTNLRLAYTHTVARPTFRELAPYATFDFYGSFVFTGNDTLSRTLIRNMDIRYEWYPNPGELIAVSAFHKELDQPIERAIRPEVNKNMTVQNVATGRVSGIEFEIRKNLGFLHDRLGNFAIASNYTVVRSSVDIPANELYNIRVSDPDAPATRSLAGQSPFILNVDLAYENRRSGFSGDLTFNRFGDRLHAVSIGAAPDIYERGTSSLDLMLRQRVGRLQFSASAKNLLDSEVRFTQEFNGRSFATQQYRTGRTFTLGVSYSI